MLRILLLLFIVTYSLPSLLAQNLSELEFGRVSTEELNILAPESEPDAEAMVLYHGWDTKVIASARWPLSQIRHRRVKLFKASAFERANIEIVYDSEWEKIDQFEAYLFLLSGERIKIPRQEINQGELEDGLVFYNFTFPQIEEGAILDYRYRLRRKTSRFLPRMDFEEDIPIKICEYKVRSHEYLPYNVYGANLDSLDIHIQENGQYNDPSGRELNYHFARFDIASIEQEPYANNIESFISSITLERRRGLANFRKLDSIEYDLIGWRALATELLRHSRLGRSTHAVAISEFFKKEVELADGDNQAEQAQNLLNLVNGQIDWDGKYRIFPERELATVWQDKIGNSAEINLVLLSLLRANDIEADPLLVGLRGNGNPIVERPILSQFQHLMVIAYVDGDTILLDADGESSIVGLPRIRALNHAAWDVNSRTPYWTLIKPPVMRQALVADIVLRQDGWADIRTSARLKDYYSLAARKSFEDELDSLEYPMIAATLDRFSDTKLIDYQYELPDSPADPIKIDYHHQSQLGEVAGEFLYVRPILINALDESLVDDEERLFPIDFPYPWQEQQVLSLHIPEGYAIEELPEPQRHLSSDRSIQISLQCIPDDSAQSISVVFNVSVKETYFPPDAYAGLRELFQRIVDLQESVIILKKMN